MDHTIHFKLTEITTAKGYKGEANFSGDSGEDIAKKVVDFMQAMGIEKPEEVSEPADVLSRAFPRDDGVTDLGWPKEEEEAKPPHDNSEFHDEALAFMATCEVHNTKWYMNSKADEKGNVRQWHSHKSPAPGPTVNDKGYCNYYLVAGQVWQELLQDHDMGETQTREFMAKYFDGLPFEKQSEMIQAIAIARLRGGL